MGSRRLVTGYKASRLQPAVSPVLTELTREAALNVDCDAKDQQDNSACNDVAVKHARTPLAESQSSEGWLQTFGEVSQLQLFLAKREVNKL